MITEIALVLLGFVVFALNVKPNEEYDELDTGYGDQ